MTNAERKEHRREASLKAARTRAANQAAAKAEPDVPSAGRSSIEPAPWASTGSAGSTAGLTS